MSANKEICEACTLGGRSFPVYGPSFSRRRFFEIAGTGIAGSYLANVLAPPRRLEAATAPALKGTARNLVFVFMAGGPSHSDLWDLKEGAWTPAAFAPTTFGGGIRFAQGLMPNIARHLGRITLLRSVLSWAAVHSLAQTWAQQSRNPAGVLGDIAPNIGSVVSLELAAQRKSGDVLPGFIALNANAGQGLRLPAGALRAARRDGPLRERPRRGEAERVRRRRGVRGAVRPPPDARRGPRPGRPARRRAGRHDRLLRAGQGARRFPDRELATSAGRPRTTRGTARRRFGGAALVAKQLLAANQGARYIQLSVGGWDNHSNIYAANGGLFSQMKFFDPAIGVAPRGPRGRSRRGAGQDAPRRDARRDARRVRPDRGPAERPGRPRPLPQDRRRAGGRGRRGREGDRRHGRDREQGRRTSGGARTATSGSRTSPARSTPRSGSTTRPCGTTTPSAAATSTSRSRRTASTGRSTRSSRLGGDGRPRRPARKPAGPR